MDTALLSPLVKPMHPPSLPVAGRQTVATRPAANRPFPLGLFIPMIGVAGIWGPSAQACATLAIEEINRGGGFRGREVVARFFDASDECSDLAEQTAAAVHDREIEALVGVHTSSVRQRVAAACAGDIPYIYTALHEGGPAPANVYMLGETPERQLAPALRHLVERRQAKRWVLIGNDYVWPRVSHVLASRFLHDCHAEVLGQHFTPLGTECFAAALQLIERLQPDAVLLSLVGQDAVEFNRQFGASGLARRCLRLSGAIEENILLAIGAGNTDDLYVAAGYFGSLSDDANEAFRERYRHRFGDRAPTLNALGQSTYEGVYFARALLALDPHAAQQPLRWPSARGMGLDAHGRARYPVHLARVEGHLFRVEHHF